jgi:hypothetical protein
LYHKPNLEKYFWPASGINFIFSPIARLSDIFKENKKVHLSKSDLNSHLTVLAGVTENPLEYTTGKAFGGIVNYLLTNALTYF